MTGVQDSEVKVQALEAIANLATASTDDDKKTIAILTVTITSLVVELIKVRKEFIIFRKSTRSNLKYYY